MVPFQCNTNSPSVPLTQRTVRAVLKSKEENIVLRNKRTKADLICGRSTDVCMCEAPEEKILDSCVP